MSGVVRSHRFGESRLPSARRPGVPVRVALCAPGELWGGVEQFVDTFAAHLQSRRVPVSAIVFHDGLLREKLIARDIPVFLPGSTGKYDPRIVSQVARFLRDTRSNVIHTHGYKATVIGSMAGRMARIAVVRTEHGRREPWRGSARIKMMLNDAAERLVSARLVDGMAYVSEDVQSHSSTATSARLPRVIYNGVDPDAITSGGAESIRSAGTFNIGIIGRLAPVKGHEYLLKAMTRLAHRRDLRLFVFGSGPLESECRRYCEAAGLESVRFMGFQSNMPAYLRQLDLLAMPSLHEGLPYTLLEAMACNVPVVASKVGGLAEVLDDRVTAMLVPPKDDEQLAAAIAAVAGDTVLRAGIAKRARLLLAEKFLISRMADSYLDLYSAALGRLR